MLSRGSTAVVGRPKKAVEEENKEGTFASTCLSMYIVLFDCWPSSFRPFAVVHLQNAIVKTPQVPEVLRLSRKSERACIRANCTWKNKSGKYTYMLHLHNWFVKQIKQTQMQTLDDELNL